VPDKMPRWIGRTGAGRTVRARNRVYEVRRSLPWRVATSPRSDQRSPRSDNRHIPLQTVRTRRQQKAAEVLSSSDYCILANCHGIILILYQMRKTGQRMESEHCSTVRSIGDLLCCPDYRRSRLRGESPAPSRALPRGGTAMDMSYLPPPPGYQPWIGDGDTRPRREPIFAIREPRLAMLSRKVSPRVTVY